MFLSILAITLGTALVAFGINQKFQFVKMISVDDGKSIITTFKGKVVGRFDAGLHIYLAYFPFIGDIIVPAMEVPAIKSNEGLNVTKKLDPLEFKDMSLSDKGRIRFDISYTVSIVNPELFYSKAKAEGHSSGDPFSVLSAEIENKAKAETIREVSQMTLDQVFGRTNDGKNLETAANNIRIRLNNYTIIRMGLEVDTVNIENVTATAKMQAQEEKLNIERSKKAVAELAQETEMTRAKTATKVMEEIARTAKAEGLDPTLVYQTYAHAKMAADGATVIVAPGSSNSPVALGAAMQRVGKGTTSTGDDHDTPGETGDER